jgi:hypothetical protein
MSVAAGFFQKTQERHALPRCPGVTLWKEIPFTQRRGRRKGECAMQNTENIQIRWLKEATTTEKSLVSMVVGWQTVAETINATVARFNAKFFEMSDSPHHEMKVIGAKQAVMASLKELKVSLGNWREKLGSQGILSAESKHLEAA